MKLLIVFFVSMTTFAAAGVQEKAQQGKAAAAQAAAAQAAAAQAAAAKEAPKVEIPAGAVQSEDGAYRYTDARGKKWIYRKTPFGVARVEDRPADPKPAELLKGLEAVKAAEDGDVIRFERPGPFGVYKWQRKKTELNEMEQAVWDREKSRNTAAKQD